MAKRSKAATRAIRRREDAAFTFLIAGAAFLILPLFFGGSPFGTGLSVMTPLGLVVSVIGGVLFFLAHPRRRHGASRVSRAQKVPTLHTVLEAPEVAAIDGVIAEFERPRQEAGAISRAPSARPVSWGPDVIHVIEWRRFEAVVEALFQQVGFDTKSQPHGADGGVDVWLFSRQHPGVPAGLVQCKHWSSKPVGVDKIRELRGVMAAKKVERGIFATTATFSADARQFGRENGIDLLDIDRLLAFIAKRPPEQQRALLDVALEGDYWRPTCVNCGTKLVERTSRKGGNAFWGCQNFPACRTTLPMRAARPS